jgi:hypothetical protein
MNPAFETVLAAGEEERRQVFLAAAARLGTALAYVEKDFWVCWTLDALFHGLAPGGPRLLFKGGTSLSKAFGLISRFSEDIDTTVFREDLGAPASVEELGELSGKKRRARLDAIKAACQEYIRDGMRVELEECIRELSARVGISPERFRVELDRDDPDRQSLLVWYPSVTAREEGYVRSAVKVESGAKSALDPHVSASVAPYAGDDLPYLDLIVRNVTTVEPARTFWDKVVILHGLRHWHDRRGILRQGGRVSRHYYDLFRLLQSKESKRWLADRELALDCARHAQLFFPGTDLGLEEAALGRFVLVPTAPMRSALARDYEAMAGMIFGEVPAFAEVVGVVEEFEAELVSR